MPAVEVAGWPCQKFASETLNSRSGEKSFVMGLSRSKVSPLNNTAELSGLCPSSTPAIDLFFRALFTVCDIEDILVFVLEQRDSKAYFELFQRDEDIHDSQSSETTSRLSQSFLLFQSSIGVFPTFGNRNEEAWKKAKAVLFRFVESNFFSKYAREYYIAAEFHSRTFERCKTTIPCLKIVDTSSPSNDIPHAQSCQHKNLGEACDLIGQLIYNKDECSELTTSMKGDDPRSTQIKQRWSNNFFNQEVKNELSAFATPCHLGLCSGTIMESLHSIDPVHVDHVMSVSRWLGPFLTTMERFPIAMCLVKPKSAAYPGHPLVFMNKHFQKVTLFDRYDVLGEDMVYLLQNPVHINFNRPSILSLILQSKSASELYMRLYRSDGSPFDTLIYTKPLLNKAEEHIYTFVTLFPTTKKTCQRRYMELVVDSFSSAIPSVL